MEQQINSRGDRQKIDDQIIIKLCEVNIELYSTQRR